MIDYLHNFIENLKDKSNELCINNIIIENNVLTSLNNELISIKNRYLNLYNNIRNIKTRSNILRKIYILINIKAKLRNGISNNEYFIELLNNEKNINYNETYDFENYCYCCLNRYTETNYRVLTNCNHLLCNYCKTINNNNETCFFCR